MAAVPSLHTQSFSWVCAPSSKSAHIFTLGPLLHGWELLREGPSLACVPCPLAHQGLEAEPHTCIPGIHTQAVSQHTHFPPSPGHHQLHEQQPCHQQAPSDAEIGGPSQPVWFSDWQRWLQDQGDQGGNRTIPILVGAEPLGGSGGMCRGARYCMCLDWGLEGAFWDRVD